jgi:hypothetical protein
MSYRDDFNEGYKETKWTFWKILWPLIGVIEDLSVCFKCGSRKHGVTGVSYLGMNNEWYSL